MEKVANLKILTVNRHTGYLYNLSKIGHRWLVLGEWEQHNRPLPANFELTDWATARRKFAKLDAVIGHDIRRDLARFLPFCLRYRIPYIQGIHGRRARGGYSRSRLRRFQKFLYSSLALRPLVKLGLIRVVFVSDYDSSDWGLRGTIIDLAVPLDEMGPYEGTEPSLLVVGNALHREHFAFDDLMQIRAQVPVKIVGVNPQIPGCRPSRDWEELRSVYRRHRAYLNLNREPEKGYNSAVLEAMGSGMPVISLKHPSSPIRNGENGFVVENASEAIERANELMADFELARRLGRCARETVERKFSTENFRRGWNDLLLSITGCGSRPGERLSSVNRA